MPHRRMAAFRASLGWSQARLADELGCTQGFVAQVEAGRKRLGLGPALALERLTSEWPEGSIRAGDWVRDDHPTNITDAVTPDEAA